LPLDRYKQCEHPDSLLKPDLEYSGRASAEHLQQCAEFALFRHRSLRALAVTVLPIPLARRAAATACATV
jgi:hypothetical protein